MAKKEIDKPAGDDAQTDLVDAVAGTESPGVENGDAEKESSPETAAETPSPDPDPVDETDPEDPPLAAEPEKPKKKLTGAAAAAQKKKADKIRRDAEIEAVQENQVGPTDEQLEAQEAKDAIVDELHEIDLEARELEESAQVLRDKSAELLLQLYPQQGPNDPHHIAVRGYLKAAHNERQNRSLAPARLKALLQAAGRAPIDAAFSRARGRGMARPNRSAPKSATPPAGDQAPGPKE